MYSRLLVPLDGSATAELALHHAAALARLSGATLVLLHVIEDRMVRALGSDTSRRVDTRAVGRAPEG